MTKIAALACATALAIAPAAFATEVTSPVQVTQGGAEYGVGLNTAATWTAAAVVVGGALILDNADSDTTTGN